MAMSSRESPPPNPPRPLAADEFSSWKDIASYLGVSVRRAQQWETELGLPVERLLTEQRGRIRARRSDIDRWLRERTEAVRSAPRDDGGTAPGLHPTPTPVPASNRPAQSKAGTRKTGRMAVVAVAVLLLAAASWFAWPHFRPAPEPPASAAIVDGQLHVLDAKGRLLWRRGFPEGWARPPAVALTAEKAGSAWRTNTTLVQDIDGDGRTEVLFVLTPTMGNGAIVGNRLICYAADGTERWRYIPGRKTRWQDRQFDANYSIWWVIGPIAIDGRLRLLVSASNAFFPCQVSLLDAATGGLVGEYWHFGALLSGLVLDTDGDGRLEAVVGGVNNPGPGNGSPALVALKLPLAPPRPDVANVFDPPRPQEAAYLLFPPVDAFGLVSYPSSVAWIRQDDWGRLQLAVSLGYNYPTNGQAYYVLDSRLAVIDGRADDLLKAYHDELRRAGQLDHRLDESEVQGWRAVRRFDAMPNANSPEVVSAWPRREGLPKPR
jgi:hypothetical protein